MIYIVSEVSDVTTDQVCEYLIGQNEPFKRINYQSNPPFSLSISEDSNSTNFLDLDVKSSDVLWIRRGRLAFIPKDIIFNTSFEVSVIKRYLRKEEDALNKSLEQFLYGQSRVIGSYVREAENYKISNLLLAQKCGLKVPETLITSTKKKALEFLKQHKNIITKDIQKPVNLNLKDEFLTSVGTFLVSESDLIALEEQFFPIFLQERIEKKLELRIFYFCTKLYSMAIFSQRDEQTKIDYRNHEKKNPLRSVPFSLPETVSKKIINFMKVLDLNTGSIDLILTPKGDYIFLEVNPQGQIDWLSKNCNYHIEKDISEYLAYKDEI